jgi:uncharacterized protein involved in oxidation of intracellular sulfur
MALNCLIIINDAPYGTEKAYNAFRLAMRLQRDHAGVALRVFLMADAVGCGLPGQDTPDGYYNIERMLRAVLAKGGEVAACGTCLKARGMATVELVAGVQAGTMAQLGQWVVEADRVVSF